MDTTGVFASETGHTVEPEEAAATSPRPAVTAAAPPSRAEQRRAQCKQKAAEQAWEPEDAQWADDAVAEDGEVLFRSVFERSAVGIALVDLEGRISKCNPALAVMLGFTVDELPGRAFTDLSHPEDSTLDQRYFEELVARRTDHYTIEKRYIRKDGTVLWGQMTASMIAADDGLPRFVIGVIEDVSERHRAEEAIRQRDQGIREAYTQVIAAVTGGKLVLMAPEELGEEFGQEVWSTETIPNPERLSEERRRLGTILEDRFGDMCDSYQLVLAAGEAMANSLKHGEGLRLRLLEKAGRPQVEVRDEGPGIDFSNLPKATLVPGFSTTTSLGMGFTIMLAVCERVLLSTGTSGTSVVLEAPAILAQHSPQ